MAAAPLPEIKEADAAGRIAALYDDIRAVIGVPMVNLIFRHMATIPGCLDWAWLTIRPLYVDGQIPAAAAALTHDVLPGVTFDIRAAAAAQPLSHDDLHAVDRVLDAYGRANPMNLIGLNVINLALDGAPQDEGVGSAASSDTVLLQPKNLPPLPPMTDPTTAPARVRDALHALAVQIHRGDTGVIPSLYRHFGTWPGFLEGLKPAVAGLFEGEEFENAARAMQASGEKRAAAFYRALPLPDMPAPDGGAVNALKGLIGQFPPNICRMTVLATVLRRGLNA
jgi:hypothetical protein